MEASHVVCFSFKPCLTFHFIQKHSRSPGHRVPWWVLIWIKRSPLVFLVLSVACFSLGFCCFAYASQQVRVGILAILFTYTLAAGLRYSDGHYSSHGFYFFRSCSCVCLVCIRTMGILSAQRPKMAQRRPVRLL